MMVKRSMGFSCHQMNKKAGEQMDTMAKINQFRDERNWRPHHNEKDLALSICLEAAELLELFQWKTAEEGIKQEERIKEELADVLIYSYMMADNLGFDLDEIIVEISSATLRSLYFDYTPQSLEKYQFGAYQN